MKQLEHVDTNAQAVTILKTLEQLAFQTLKPMLHARDCHPMRNGTQLRASRRHGAALHGLRQMPVAITLRQAQITATSNVIRITHGRLLLQPAKPIQKFQTAQGLSQMRIGIQFQQLPRHGTALLGCLQQLELTTPLLALQNVDTNVIIIIFITVPNV